jgi:hypothetical protein
MQKIIAQQMLERLQYLSDYQYDCGNLEITLKATTENQQLMHQYNAWIEENKNRDGYQRHGNMLMEEVEGKIYGNEIGMIEFLIEQLKSDMQAKQI